MGVKVPRADIVEAQKHLWQSLPHVDHQAPERCCWACGDTVEAPDRAHLVARAHKGNDEPSNLVLLCGICHAEHPDGQPVEVQLLWLETHESKQDRKLREAFQVIEAMTSLASSQEVQQFMESRELNLANCRTASTRPHTVWANATWALVSEFLAWKGQRVG